MSFPAKSRFIPALFFSALSTLVAGAQVRWLEDTHNFGAFDENLGKVSCEMKFINESNKPVVINQVHVTCGCTSPTFDKKAIEPGDTGAVIISYNPTGRPGRFEKKIYVDINTTPSRYTLYIKGSVIGSPTTIKEKYPVEVGPLRLRTSSVPFGEVTQGSSKTYFLEIYNASTDTVTPEWIALPKYISVGSATKQLYPGENMAFTFMLASDKVKELGLTIDSLKLAPYGASNIENAYDIPITVMVKENFSNLTPGQVKNAPIIEFSTESIKFEEIKADDSPVTKTFKIYNKGKDPLFIRRIYSADKGITVTVGDNKVKKGKETVATVTLNPSVLASDVVNARVSVISNDPIEPVANIRISGLIIHDNE